MVEFQISAPASLSLFGEHVNNSLRTSIDLRTTLKFQVYPLWPHSNYIEINFPEINLFLQLPLQNFVEYYNHCVKNINLLNSQMLFTYLFSPDKTQREFLQIFYYLLVYIINEEKMEIKAFSIFLTTQFNKKFISLASLKVCIAAWLLYWSHLQKGNLYTFDVTDLNKICTYATRCKNTEKCSILETSDIIACTYGTVVRYEIERDKWTLFYLPRMTILLVDSKQTQNVEARNQRMTELIDQFPKLAIFIFNNISNIANMAADIFQKTFDTYMNNELNFETKTRNLFQKQKALEVSHNMNSTKKCFVVRLCVAAFSVSFFISFI